MTKVSFKLIFAAFAATVALTACTKEPTPAQTDQIPASPAAEGTRVIAVSFAPQTKTTLEKGAYPKFNGDDSILLVTIPDDPKAEVDTQTVAVSVDPKTDAATITTTLSGKLKALYPAHMAIEGKGGFNILVPAVQTGKFADANICSATIEENDTAVQFENKYALFVITPPEGTKSLTIKSLKGVGEDGQRSGTQFTISNANTLDGEGCTITIPNAPLDKDGKYYVAVCENARLSDLSFEAWSNNDGTTGSIKGIPTSSIELQAKEHKQSYSTYNPIASGTVYNIIGNNWHEYITIAGRKWATSNVSTYENYDDYFMWGTTVLAYESIQDDVVTMKSSQPYGSTYMLTWTPTKFFSWENTPFTSEVFNATAGNAVFTKYTASIDSLAYNNTADKKEILELCDDAANANWGGAWRMPTIEELDKGPAPSNLSCSGVMQFDWYDQPNNLGGTGYYWSSSVDATDPSKAKCLWIDIAGNKELQSQPRFWGCTIRAIIDDPAAYNQEDAPQD